MPGVRRRIARSDERAYLIARWLVVAILTAESALGLAHLESSVDRFQYFGALVGFTLIGGIQSYAFWVSRTGLKRTMLIALPFDLLFIGMSTTVIAKTGDLGFAYAIAWPVLYALVFRRRETWLVGLGTAGIYTIASLTTAASSSGAIVELGIKACIIVLIGGRVAYSEQMQRVREQEIEQASAENARLNTELNFSLGELQALLDVTGHIHASLDFDMVAGPVLDTITRALDIDAGAFYVLDNTSGEVLSCASLRLPLNLVLPPEPGHETCQDGADFETPLSCFCPYDESHLRLVFCGRSDDVARLTENEHLLLQAMGREVAIAVDNSQLYKLTKRMAVTDELTGLHNYRYLQQRISEEVTRAQRYESFCTLLMIDADDFKAFNDAYGHVAGDHVLKELGQVLTANVRAVDLVARYGGEEFSVLLPETDMMGALAAAEKLRDGVAAHSFQQPYDRHLSVSIGLATYPTHGIDAESLLRAADDALYVAKNSGKNQVRVPDVYDGQASVVGIA